MFLIKPPEVRPNLFSPPTNYFVKKTRKQCEKCCKIEGEIKELKQFISPHVPSCLQNHELWVYVLSLLSCYSQSPRILVSTTVMGMWVVLLEVRMRSLLQSISNKCKNVMMFDHFFCFKLRLWMWLLCICSVLFNFLWQTQLTQSTSNTC